MPFASRFYDGANFLPFPRATDAALAADGRILIAGPVNEGIDALLRLEASGDLDPSFSPLNAPRNDQFEYEPYGPEPGGGIGIDAAGRVVVTGMFATLSCRRLNLRRLSPGGASDEAFRAEIMRTGIVSAVAAQQGDKVIVSGEFDSVGGHPYAEVVRLRSDASVDTSFGGAIFDANHRSVTSVLVGGDELLVSEQALDVTNGRIGGILARVNADAADDSREVLLRVDRAPIYPLAIQSDGKFFATVRYSALSRNTTH